MEATLKPVEPTQRFEPNGKSSRISGFCKLDVSQRLDKLDDWQRWVLNLATWFQFAFVKRSF